MSNNQRNAKEPLLWNPMSTAPRQNEEHIILLHITHGVVEGWFSPGYWSDETPDHPREYSGSVWVCGDDAFEEEVEELPPELGGYHDGPIIGWLPRDVLPLRIPEEHCPGHVTSDTDPKVCGKCGVHIDSLRLDNDVDAATGTADDQLPGTADDWRKFLKPLRNKSRDNV